MEYIDEEYELQLDPNITCRTCLTENSALKSIFCSEIVDGNVLPFPKVFQIATDLKVTKNDGLPEKICLCCKAKINEFYIFKQKCKKSNELLQKIFAINDDKFIEEEKITSEKIAPGTITTETITDLLNVTDDKIEPEMEYLHIKEEAIPHTLYIETQNVDYLFNSLKPKIEAILEIEETDEKITDESEERNEENIFLEDNSNNKMHTVVQQDENEEMYMEVTNEASESSEEIYLNKREEETDYNNADIVCDKASTEEAIISIQADSPEESIDYEVIYNEETIDVMSEDLGEPEYLYENDSENDASENKSTDNDVKRLKITKTQETDIINTTNSQIWCIICNRTLKTDNFQKHMNYHKQTLPLVLDSRHYYRCGVCMSIYPKEDDLRNHLITLENCKKKSTIARDILCTDYQFLDDSDSTYEYCLAHRTFSIVKISDTLFKCDWCSEYEGTSLNCILKHYSDTHFIKPVFDNTIEQYYYNSFFVAHKCGICSRKFTNFKESISHVYLHADSFCCPYDDCKYEYKKFYLLNQHMMRVHMLNKQHSCGHCDQILDTYIELQTHIQWLCPNRTFKCEFCDKKFFSQATLTVHKKGHQMEKRYACKVCEKKFVQKGDLKIHFRIHTGVKPYKCFKCSKTFRSIGNRKDHMSTHEKEKKFMCDICQQTFISDRTLRGHMVIHKDNKKFACGFCEKKFYRRYHLKLHTKTHHRALLE